MIYPPADAWPAHRRLPLFAGLVWALGRRLRDWRLRRGTLDELHALSDRELRDMGINRRDFDAIACGTFAADERGREER
jgi:uncharacterized protein YjiS (DUF1127 family)